ncbi:hypothetical protein [Aeromonas veronii]|uniref:hypothetical protein n=1 Tax=Aeromonas TaxID=642 RepID=UPI003BA142C4
MLKEWWLEISDSLYGAEYSFDDNLSAKTVFLNYALSLINGGNRDEVLESCFAIIVEESGCVEDFEILDILADKLVAEHVLTEDELIVFFKNADYGRWS